MANLRTLSDVKKATSSEHQDLGQALYTGGASSGTAVFGGEPSGDAASRIIGRSRAAAESQGGSEPGTDAIKVTFYANGFCVADGPLRGDSEQDKRFLSDIDRGLVPAELRQGRSGDVHIAIDDQRAVNFSPPPPPAYTAFGGEGNRLSAGSTSTSAAGAVDGAAAVAGSSIELKDGEPVLKVQVRLATGKRTVLKLNSGHTVSQVQAAIAAMTPGVTSFTLVAGFPPKPLVDSAATVAEAGIAGAAVTQKAL